MAKLEVSFTGLPGELKVRRRRFSIYQARGIHVRLNEDNWKRHALPGASFFMAISIEGNGFAEQFCPLCRSTSHSSDASGWMQWCALTPTTFKHTTTY